jgi:hypothetical protein
MSVAKIFFVVRALFNDFCFCFFIKYIVTQKGNAEIAGGGYDHFEECVLKIKQKTFTSRTAQLYVPSKPVKVVRPIGKRQGALHLDRFAMRHRVLTPLRKVKEK